MTTKVNHQALPYFANLPPALLPALQSAWDRGSTGGFEPSFIFEGLSRDINALNHVAPDRREFNSWLHAVRSGDIARPVALKDATFQPITTADFAKNAEATVDASALVLKTLLDQMVEDLVAEITKDARQEAKRRVGKLVGGIAADMQ